MKIPDKAKRIMHILKHDMGARDVLIVGGFVRDSILGVQSKDVDIEVYGLNLSAIESALADTGEFKVDAVGKAFGVLKIDNEIDVSVPRRENKVGVGHKGFDVMPDPNMSVEEAASRRDFTINSMAMDIDGNIIDPFQGESDLRLSVLRATSQAFVEDPLRVMRAMQFAARFGVRLEYDTVVMCRNMLTQKSELPKERIWEEWKKWALRGKNPASGLRLLKEVGWLDNEIADLVDCPQDPEWHPEGWLAFVPFGREIFTINSSLTSPTHTNRINDGFGFGQFIDTTLAKFTTSPSASSTTGTQSSEIDPLVDSFSTTSPTRSPSFQLPATLGKTSITKPVSFMCNISSGTPRASKVVRIMLEISQSSMFCIMRSAINDLEVVDTIVSPISIFMMNMLFGEQWSTQFQLHKDAMQTNGPLFTGPTNICIPVIVANAFSDSIDSNILISFDLSFEDDVDFIHDDFLIVDKNDPSLLYTKITQGDVFIHTGHVVDAAAVIAEREQLDDHDRLVLMFAALTHDFGKPSTTKMEGGRWRSKGHCQAGVEHAERFLGRIGAPLAIIAEVLPLVSEHLVHAGIPNPSPKAVRRLANRIAPASIEALARVVESDHSGRPPLPKGNPLRVWVDKAHDLNVFSEKPKPFLMGRHLVEMGVKPGKPMGVLLNKAFEAQLDGVFVNEEDARRWANDHMGS